MEGQGGQRQRTFGRDIIRRIKIILTNEKKATNNEEKVNKTAHFNRSSTASWFKFVKSYKLVNIACLHLFVENHVYSIYYGIVSRKNHYIYNGIVGSKCTRYY